MNTAARLAGFGLVLVVALGGGYGVGTAAGPLSSGTGSAEMPAEEAETHQGEGTATSDGHSADQADDGAHGDDAASARSDALSLTEATLGGLSATLDGYSLQPRSTILVPGDPFLFTVTGPDGAVVTAYEEESTKELHLIAVRRDGADYRHVHPTRDPSGQWLGEVDLTPGSWRVVADTVPAAASGNVALGIDVQVAGDYNPAAPSEPSTSATVQDYLVTVDGAPVAGQPTVLRFAVFRGGLPVATQPYLGALGHLVVTREDDLGYLHVHPETDALAFTATFPTSGRYLLFLDVTLDGQVHTAPFTVEVGP